MAEDWPGPIDRLNGADHVPAGALLVENWPQAELLVTLTLVGRRRLAAMDPHVGQAAEHCAARLSAAEQRTLKGLLAKLLGDGTVSRPARPAARRRASGR